jgi:hypothetical protein
VSQVKWKRREAKLHKKKTGMRVSGRSIFTLQEVLKKKAVSARKTKAKPKSRTSSE